MGEKPLTKRVYLFLHSLLFLTASSASYADEWADIATTDGITANIVCAGSDDGKDIDCAQSNGVTIDDTGNLQSNATISSTANSGLIEIYNTNATESNINAGSGADLNIGINGADIMTLKPTGVVGIGVTDPQTRLHINGSLIIGDGAESCTAGRAGAIRYTASEGLATCNGTTWDSLGSAASLTDTNGDTRIEAEATSNDDTLRFITDNAERLTITETINANAMVRLQPLTGGSGEGGEFGTINLNNLGNVNVGTVSNGELVYWDNSANLWQNTTGITYNANNLTATGYLAAASIRPTNIPLNTMVYFDGTALVAAPAIIGGGGETTFSGQVNASIFSGSGAGLTGVIADEVIANAINTSHITNGAITTDDLANNSITATQLNVPDNGTSGQLLSSSGDGSFAWLTPTIGATEINALTDGASNSTSVFLGNGAGVGGANNTAVGINALASGLGNNNTAIGHGAGSALTSGSNNIIIGSNQQAPSATGSHQLNIGGTLYGDLANNYIGIGETNPNVALDINGSVEFTGTMTDLSDRRLKENIQNLAPNQLENIAKIRPVSFRMKNDKTRTIEYGVIAQEFEHIYPELVKTAHDDMGTKSVNYIGLIAPMLSAIQELKAENESLRARLDILEAQK